MEELITVVSSPGDEKVYEQLRRITQLPLPTQRIMHLGGASHPSQFWKTTVIETPEQVKLVKQVFGIKWGKNGYYIKSVPSRGTWVIFKKKGRSSSRLEFLRTSDTNQRFTLFIELAEFMKIDLTSFTADKVFSNIITQGLMSNILVGKVTTMLEATSYYNSYSLRCGISKENVEAILDLFYISSLNRRELNWYLLRKVILYSYNPNEFVKQFQALADEPSVKATMLSKYCAVVTLAEMLNTKIDWIHEDYDSIRFDLAKKAEVIKEILYLWDGGHSYESRRLSRDSINVTRMHYKGISRGIGVMDVSIYSSRLLDF